MERNLKPHWFNEMIDNINNCHQTDEREGDKRETPNLSICLKKKTLVTVHY